MLTETCSQNIREMRYILILISALTLWNGAFPAVKVGQPEGGLPGGGGKRDG